MIGKIVGTLRYVHYTAEHVLPQKLLAAAKLAIPPGFPYTVVRYDSWTNAFAFVQSPDFDTAPEPSVGAMVVVFQDGLIQDGLIRMRPARDEIYHHKWMFVEEDYTGFDIAASKARSVAWTSLDPPVDSSRIGSRTYWETHVVPRIEGL